MNAIILPATAFGGLTAIYLYGRRSCPDRLSRSFPLLAVLLLITPLGWSFGLRIGDSITTSIPIAFLGVVAFLVVERHQWRDFYLDRDAVLQSLIDGIIVCVFLVVPFSLFLIYSRTGQVIWSSSNNDISNYLVQTTRIAFFEELLYRSLFLGYLRRFRIGAVWANLIQTAFFLTGHLHYLEGPDYLLFSFVLVFGLIQGYVVQKRGNLAGALLIHTAANFVPLVLSNGHIPAM